MKVSNPKSSALGRRANKLALLGAASIAGIAAGNATAQTSAKPADRDTVTIVGQGYKADLITSATRTNTPLIDVPQAVNVVTVEQIEDQAANSVADTVR